MQFILCLSLSALHLMQSILCVSPLSLHLLQSALCPSLFSPHLLQSTSCQPLFNLYTTHYSLDLLQFIHLQFIHLQFIHIKFVHIQSIRIKSPHIKNRGHGNLRNLCLTLYHVAFRLHVDIHIMQVICPYANTTGTMLIKLQITAYVYDRR